MFDPLELFFFIHLLCLVLEQNERFETEREKGSRTSSNGSVLKENGLESTHTQFEIENRGGLTSNSQDSDFEF